MVMPRRSPLDDPQIAQFAWARYLRVMRWLMLTTVTLVVGGMVALYRSTGTLPVQVYILAAMGIGFVMLLASAVMGLRLLFGRSARDRAVIHPQRDDRNN